MGYIQVLSENHIGEGFLRKPQPPERHVEVVEEADDGSVVGDPGMPVPAP